jgi:hypothetical protein
MRKRTLVTRGVLIFYIMLLSSPSLYATSLDHITILKISSIDQSAVIRGPGAKIRLIKPGDRIGENSQVLEIDEGRIVLEENTAQGKETVIIYLEKGNQRLERIRKGSAPNQTLYVPQTAVKQE